MKQGVACQRQSFGVRELLLCIGITILAMIGFAGGTVWMAAAAVIFVSSCFCTGAGNRLCRLPVLLVLGWVAVSGLTGFWAISGKFFLRNFSMMAVAAGVFLWVITGKERPVDRLKRVMGLVAGVSAAFGLFSVEAATTGLTAHALHSLRTMESIGIGFEDGTRLTGILGNANILASILALGIFFSLALLCQAKDQTEKRLFVAFLAINAYTFLLAFSMGGMACFVVALIVFLAFAGNSRGTLLLRMLEGAIPSLVWGFVAFPFFNRGGALGAVPLVLLVANIATVILLEEKAAPRLEATLAQRQKEVLGLLIGIVALVVVYVVAGLSITGGYTFQGEELRRGAYPEPGIHTLVSEGAESATVTIVSQNMNQVMMHTNTVLYQGPVSGAEFTVPEASEVCYFTFTAPAGEMLERVLIDGETEIPLNYRLLPGFIANRIQGLKANQNAIQRTVFFEDGMKLFRQHPVLGGGLGAFESACFSVQEFYYETKYVHNHYIQVLLDSGVVGLMFYVGSLLSLLWVLFQGRKKAEEDLAWTAPALWAAMVMILTHSAVEVSMSDFTFQCMAFAVFGCVTLGFAPALSRETEEASAQKNGKKKANYSRSGKELAVRGALCVLPAVFLVTLGLNGISQLLVKRPTNDLAGFLEHLQVSAKIDPYEGNDAKLSYVVNSLDDQTGASRAQADAFAEELMTVQSNSIPVNLTTYYLSTNRPLQAIEAAKWSAVCSAADYRVWNNCIHLLGEAFLTNGLPMDEAVTAALQEYHQMLLDYNAKSMEPIQLDEESQNILLVLGLSSI